MKSLKLHQIPKIARLLAKKLKGGEIVALIGPLGSGKTTFVKALGKELKIKQRITSPTFALLHDFSVRVKHKHVQLYHLDLYRTRNFKEVEALGLNDLWGKPNTITFIEWADKIKKHLPPKTRYIYFGDL